MAIISKDLDPGSSAPPLAGFALTWRWLAGSRHPLPPHVLAKLQVLPARQAQAAFRASSALLDGGGLDAARFTLRRHDAVTHAGKVKQWLRSCQPSMKTRVWLSWEPELALCTRWGVFIQHWPAFCYPGSDDLVVFPASQRWAVFHHHTQRLEFGRQPAAEAHQPSEKLQAGLKTGSGDGVEDAVHPSTTLSGGTP
jgi:hypothetical protein